MRIGSFTLDSPVLLAPMAGVTDLPFRQLCRRLGAGLTTAEMLTADTRLWNSTKSQRRRVSPQEPSPRSVQIAGAEPAMMANAARQAVDEGAQLVDINMGCPAKKVCHRAAGSALLRDEQLVADILTAVVGAVTVPVTLKIRTGWSVEERNGVRIARIAEDCGIQALAVHGRTRADRFQGQAEHETLACIRQAVRIPLIANGDITSPQQASAVLAQTGADAVMIGRAAQGNPWIFREITHFLATGKPAAPPAREEVRAVLHEHLTALHRHYGELQGTRIARKHVGWYLDRQPGWDRDRFNRASTPEAQLALIDHFLQDESLPFSHLSTDMESIAA